MAGPMTDDERRTAVLAAQTLEKRGLLDAALQAYVAAGALEDAGRLLFGHKRYLEAGQLLLGALKVPSTRVGELDQAGRRQALQGAICLARAGETASAVEWFVALGERERAADLLRKTGDAVGAARVVQTGKTPGPLARSSTTPTAVQPGMTLAGAQTLENAGKHELALDAYLQLRQPEKAARMSLKLGRHAQAAGLFVTAGKPWDAALAWSDAGDGPKALEALLRVPREDPNYRAAATRAVRLASDLNALDFQLEHFLTRYLEEPPQNERELEAFYLLGKLYQRHDFLENARDAWTKLARVNPTYRDVPARLDQLARETRGSAMVYEQILREDASFRSTPTAGTLLELPDLPGLPGLPPVAARPPSRPPVPLAAPADAWAVGPEEGTLASVPAHLRMSPAPATRAVPPIASPSSNPSIPPRPGTPRPPPSMPGATLPPPPAPVAPPPPAAPSFTPGSVIADRYRLTKKIGQGGMAAVFSAHDLELSEEVAIKIFTKLLDDEQMVARFKQELTLSRQLNHPNIIRLYDIGAVQGFRYITMELLTGGDLKNRLAKPIAVVEGLDYLIQACAALQAAHDKGIVHRDIKPANLFLTGDGVVKLMDFGIAKRTATPGLTVAGMVAGTPEYMSPEQINGFDTVTGSTDLYALGVMAYEMFTGAVPFQHAEIMPLLMLQMLEPPVPPRAKNPAIPGELERIILKLLEKDRANRFASCRELAAALEALRVKLGGKPAGRG